MGTIQFIKLGEPKERLQCATVAIHVTPMMSLESVLIEYKALYHTKNGTKRLAPRQPITVENQPTKNENFNRRCNLSRTYGNGCEFRSSAA